MYSLASFNIIFRFFFSFFFFACCSKDKQQYHTITTNYCCINLSWNKRKSFHYSLYSPGRMAGYKWHFDSQLFHKTHQNFMTLPAIIVKLSLKVLNLIFFTSFSLWFFVIIICLFMIERFFNKIVWLFTFITIWWSLLSLIHIIFHKPHGGHCGSITWVY